MLLYSTIEIVCKANVNIVADLTLNGINVVHDFAACLPAGRQVYQFHHIPAVWLVPDALGFNIPVCGACKAVRWHGDVL